MFSENSFKKPLRLRPPGLQVIYSSPPTTSPSLIQPLSLCWGTLCANLLPPQLPPTFSRMLIGSTLYPPNSFAKVSIQLNWLREAALNKIQDTVFALLKGRHKNRTRHHFLFHLFLFCPLDQSEGQLRTRQESCAFSISKVSECCLGKFRVHVHTSACRLVKLKSKGGG